MIDVNLCDFYILSKFLFLLCYLVVAVIERYPILTSRLSITAVQSINVLKWVSIGYVTSLMIENYLPIPSDVPNEKKIRDKIALFYLLKNEKWNHQPNWLNQIGSVLVRWAYTDRKKSHFLGPAEFHWENLTDANVLTTTTTKLDRWMARKSFNIWINEIHRD